MGQVEDIKKLLKGIKESQLLSEEEKLSLLKKVITKVVSLSKIPF